MRLTELEAIQKHKQNLFFVSKQINQGNFTIEEIGDNIKGSILHLNSGKDLSLKYMGPDAIKIFKREREMLYALGESLFKQHSHPYTVKYIFPLIRNFHQKAKKEDTFTYLQGMKGANDKDYRIILTTAQRFKSQESFIKLTLPIDELEQSTKKMEYLLESEEFARKNFWKFESLSEREKQVLTLTADGKKAPEISDLLFISRHTVNNHRKSINKKLDIRSYHDVVRYAIAFDLMRV